MKHKEKLLALEETYHDKVASHYAVRSETDYIWEIPSEILLFRRSYIKLGDTVIDFGCGPSTLIRNLISPEILKGIRYIGVDVSPEMIKFAKKNIPTGFFIVGDMQKVTIPRTSADVIISLGALHHAINMEKTVEFWLELLNKKGVILMREPTLDAFRRGQGESPAEEGIEVGKLIKLVNKHGAKILSLRYFNSTAFHLFNRALIKIGLSKWQQVRLLWYPVFYLDLLVSNLLGFIPVFKGLAFAAIIKKK